VDYLVIPSDHTPAHHRRAALLHRPNTSLIPLLLILPPHLRDPKSPADINGHLVCESNVGPFLTRQSVLPCLAVGQSSSFVVRVENKLILFSVALQPTFIKGTENCLQANMS